MEPHEFKQQYGANPVPNLLQFPSTYPAWSSNFSGGFLPSSDDQFHVPFHVFSPNTSSVSIGSTLDDEARENRVSNINERRLKRVISNRESARRSRLRKKKLIEELQFQVNQVKTINHQLSEKIILLLESNNLILQENVQLKEKVSSLQILLSDLMTPLRGLEEVTAPTANMNSLRAEASSQSIHH
ncbi:basic leucine zipper 43 [Pistacia vera]|uniref:basic leucine zipper 43 n=1 Tax=Pistacia vera TaxID=55513 RepID=UPI00126371CD|nr:basic leucine zipper 43 [Pistacia vera]